jgi:hypothetical protein
MAKTAKISFTDQEINKFFNQEEHAGEIKGFIFNNIVDLHEYDNHGGTLFQIVVQKLNDNTLFAGEVAVNTGEGEIYEFPVEFKPVTCVEKTIVVTEYVYN